MMPTVTLSDEYDGKLKRLVTDPFEQTRESIIRNLIDSELERRGKTVELPAILAHEDEAAIRLDPTSPGSLYHTKILSATIDGRSVVRPKWNGLREEMHVLALKHV